MENRVSVIIPTYNRSALIVRAVRSALANITLGDEIIVVDDGSTDNTAEVLRPFYGRIRYVRKENSGAGAARNFGINLASCPFVTFLDSDDEWLPDKLYLQRAIMEAYPHVVFCFSDLLGTRLDGGVVHNVLNVWRNDSWVGFQGAKKNWEEIFGPGVLFSSVAKLPENRGDFKVYSGRIYESMMEVQNVSSITIMVRKESAGAAFRFAEDQCICEDWECFARLAKAGPVAYLDCETAIQNAHPELRLTDVGDFHQATARIKLLHRVWGTDDSFIILYSSRFKSVLKVQHLRRARYLIKEGRKQDAKEELKIIGGGPWSYRLLTTLPLPLINKIIGMHRKLVRGRENPWGL